METAADCRSKRTGRGGRWRSCQRRDSIPSASTATGFSRRRTERARRRDRDVGWRLDRQSPGHRGDGASPSRRATRSVPRAPRPIMSARLPVRDSRRRRSPPCPSPTSTVVRSAGQTRRLAFAPHGSLDRFAPRSTPRRMRCCSFHRGAGRVTRMLDLFVNWQLDETQPSPTGLISPDTRLPSRQGRTGFCG